ncbi:c-type cytochrome [Paracoccus limosus]|jgi:cytochrome c|uniref:C-type cytochrome n=1 Tax=Paracoccus limosus TaxID=913252 RepID=A0A844H018_9RHOB|nr:cytochrome c family protein [Paracoccus limosus]MTH34236.1 c-type cytochrome [Paracoccus limosus]
MFDTMTVTKAAGALIGSLLFLLLMSWAASGIYNVGSAGHGEGAEHAQAYTIPVETAAAGGGEAAAKDEGPDFATVLASADPAAGEKVFGKCKACHKTDGSDSTGPHLNGVVGRPVASAAGFNYSDGMKAHATEAPVWTPEAIEHFITNPKAAVKGTKMAFAGLPKVEDRANLISYLETLK